MSGIAEVSPERFEHGTRARYVAGKCRCDECRTANREARHAAILARPDVSRFELRQRFPCWYGGASGDQRLTRDLQQVRPAHHQQQAQGAA